MLIVRKKPATISLAMGLLLATALGCGSEERDARESPDERGAPVAAGVATRLEPSEVDASNAQDYARQESQTDWSGGNPEQGAKLYMQACWVCHGAAGRGRGPAAESLNPKPRDFRVGRFYIDANANGRTGEPIDLARVILVGTEAFGGSELMQGWHEVLTTDEVRNVVAYVLSFSRKP